MTIITRKRRDNFAIVPNAVANDDRLSFEARGLLVYLLAKPHDWEIRRSDLQRTGGIGRDKAQKLMRELIAAGYMERLEDKRDESGRIIGPQYAVSDFVVESKLPLSNPEPENPVLDEPEPDLPAPAKPEPENPVPYKEQNKTNSPQTPLPGGLDRFGEMKAKWRLEQIGDEESASRAFAKLSAEDQEKAIACAGTFIWTLTRRKKRLPRLRTYLAEGLFHDFYAAPEVDRDGYFIITPSREEWSPWLGYIRRNYGADNVDRTVKRGYHLTKQRWPDAVSTPALA